MPDRALRRSYKLKPSSKVKPKGCGQTMVRQALGKERILAVHYAMKPACAVPNIGGRAKVRLERA